MLKNNRYIGGGKLYFTSEDDGAVELDLGEVKNINFKVETEEAKAYDNSEVLEKLVDVVAIGVTATLTFDTQTINIQNMALATKANLTSETFTDGQELPDGTTVSGDDVVVPVIDMAKKPIIRGKFRFVGDENGDEKPVLLIYSAALKSSSDFGYISKEFQTLSFEGEVLKTATGYAKEYRMTVPQS